MFKGINVICDRDRNVQKNPNEEENKSSSDYHKGCRGDVREEVDRHPSAYEHSCSQAGEALAAAPAGGVGPGVVTNYNSSLLKVPKTVLQVVTETLSWGEKEVFNVQ